MREPRRSPAAARWLLAIALGLLGLAGAPAADALSAGALAGPSGAAVATTADSGARTVRVGTVRVGAGQRAIGRASSPRPAHAVAGSARHHAGPSAPVTPVAFAPAGPDVRPVLVRTVRPAAGFTEPVVAATGGPRGRAPPTTRI
ncbi:hypothetical protein GCM10009527_056500 [Actinomadura nitritigenes]|uniref:Uncharacterized protein n=1 Tax=Actinomadura nitritigenes TaxID=134602 RepID=A0ABS3R9X0_9ACTN|nr:hypothetical protein [Actinomadura nitritigenes]MBO2442433.1 hypothetical protein [Actinomadura nitritigenes]